MEDADIGDGDFLMNEVEINLNVLCVLVLYGVGGEVDSTNVMVVDKHTLL
jgi:hypothetical protein